MRVDLLSGGATTEASKCVSLFTLGVSEVRSGMQHVQLLTLDASEVKT